MHPREYLSFSQLTLWERDPDEYINQYIYDRKHRSTKNMDYGTKFADGMESGEATGDAFLDIMSARTPRFELRDKIVEDIEKGTKVNYEHDGKSYVVPFIKDKKIIIPILAKPDTAKTDYTAFKEYKTSTKKWTQKMVDDSGQITFYAMSIWLKTGLLPKDIELIDIQVEYGENGAITPTGDLWPFKTNRNMIDIVKMITRSKKAWKEIGIRCEKELI